MKKFNIVIIFALFLLFLSSCDKSSLLYQNDYYIENTTDQVIYCAYRNMNYETNEYSSFFRIEPYDKLIIFSAYHEEEYNIQNISSSIDGIILKIGDFELLLDDKIKNGPIFHENYHRDIYLDYNEFQQNNLTISHKSYIFSITDDFVEELKD